jgi:large subunit ribosomal protein L22
MEAIASAKYLRGSAQKARLVVDMIRGKDVNKALAILRYSSKRASLLIEKCVRSAIANANEAAEKANVAIDPDDLWVYREQRHFCHVTILVSNDERPEPKAARHGDGKVVVAKPAKLAESKGRKRGGAAAAPRAKRVAPKTEASDKADAAAKAEGEKKATKRAAKKKASKVDE